jgi:hypothetical protein
MYNLDLIRSTIITFLDHNNKKIIADDDNLNIITVFPHGLKIYFNVFIEHCVRFKKNIMGTTMTHVVIHTFKKNPNNYLPTN